MWKVLVLLCLIAILSVSSNEHAKTQKTHNSRHLTSHSKTLTARAYSISSSANLQICYDSRNNAQITYLSHGYGVAFNITSATAVLFSDQTRTAFAFDFQSQSGAEITNSNSDTSWEQILAHTSSFQHLVQIGHENGTGFSFSSLTQRSSSSIIYILRNLDSNYSQISTFFSDVRNLFRALSGNLRIFRNLRIRITSGLQSFIRRLTGIGLVIRGGGRSDGFLNPLQIFNATRGIDAFMGFVRQLARFNPLTLFGDQIRNFLDRIDSFGCSCNSFDRFLHSIAEIGRVLSGGGGGDANFVSTMFHEFGDFSNFSNLLNQWRSSFQNLFSSVGGSSSWGSLQQLEDLGGSINGFDLSNIFSIFRNVNQTAPINSLVQLLVALSRNFSPQTSIPSLLGQVIGLYRNSTNGSDPLLQHLFPNSDANQSRDSSNIVNQFLTLFQNGAEMFVNIPLQLFLGPISRALGRCSNDSLTLPGVFQGPESLANFAYSAGFGNLIQEGVNEFANFTGALTNGFGNLITAPLHLFQQGIGENFPNNQTRHLQSSVKVNQAKKSIKSKKHTRKEKHYQPNKKQGKKQERQHEKNKI